MAIYTTNTKTFTEKMMDRVKEVYYEESKRIVDKHKEQISDEIDKLMSELVLRAGLRIEEVIAVQDMGRELRITIIKENKKS